MGARIEPETDQDHPDGPDGFSPLASVPFFEIPDPLDAVLAGSLGQKGSDFRVRQVLQVGAVVQYLGDGGPRELLALELEDHQSAVLVDARKVNETGLDRNLAADQGEPAHQHVGVGASTASNISSVSTRSVRRSLVPARELRSISQMPMSVFMRGQSLQIEGQHLNRSRPHADAVLNQQVDEAVALPPE